MLTKRIRRQIEWHFKNYNADAALYEERIEDITSSGMIANYSGIGGCGGISSPTEKAAFKLLELDNERTWATVVRNTFIAFRFEIEYDVMVDLYINHKPIKDILNSGLCESTFYRWRDNWLEYAYKWAKKFNLF